MRKSRDFSCRLRIEPLEARRLLAGLQVSVFVDQDGSRSFEVESEQAAVTRLVYLDLDKSGSHEIGEPIQVTDAEGTALFDGLPSGDYAVGLLNNPRSQLQTTSTRVSPTATLESASAAGRLLSLSDLSQLWTVNDAGLATSHSDAAIGSPSADLGGKVLDHLQDDEAVWLLVENEDGNRVVEFDLFQGSAAPLNLEGLSAGDSVRQFIETATNRFALVDTLKGQLLTDVNINPGVVSFSNAREIDADMLAGSLAIDAFASVKFVGELSQVTVHDADDVMGEPTPVLLDGRVQMIEFSGDGSRLFAAMESGGVNVLSFANGSLSLEAILADANGPVTAMSVDGRVVTASSRREGEILVWDPETWQPLGNAVLQNDASITSIVTDIFGDRALVASSEGVYSVDLAQATPLRVELSNDTSVSSVNLGLRVVGSNNLPSGDVEPRGINEDVGDQLELSEITDPDGDSLWFTLMTPPAHGSLEMLPDGSWSYVPHQHYFGDDTATLLVYDGMDSTELELHWDIAPVNDPPIAVYWQTQDLAENTVSNIAIGHLAVVDPDPDAQYRITSSDPRFSVSNGQVLFNEGVLDFESEPVVVFDVLARDARTGDEITSRISLNLTNVNEPPTDISLANDTISENKDGAVVSDILVVDPDASDQYQYSVSDERFEIVDGVLKLRPGQVIDHEAEEKISLTVTAKEIGGDGHEVAKEIVVSVADVNESPTDFLLDSDIVEGGAPGAIVGKLTVEDPDDDTFLYEVSDDRFEVVGGVLRLRDEVSVSYAPDAELTVTVVATSSSGDKVSRPFPIRIAPPSSPHQNPNDPNDVNGDGVVTPLDALILVNELNSGGGGKLPATGEGSGEGGIYRDVNGDGVLSPLDVLLIINELNTGSHGAVGGEGEASPADGFAFDTSDDEERRRRHNSEIDSELESLLDALSRQRYSNS